MEPIDIWRPARFMVDKYGVFAPQECRQRADEFGTKGDTDAESVWEAITRATESLLENWPSAGRSWAAELERAKDNSLDQHCLEFGPAHSGYALIQFVGNPAANLAKSVFRHF